MGRPHLWWVVYVFVKPRSGVLEGKLRSVIRRPRQGPIVFLDQAPEACWDFVRAGDEDPVFPLALQLAPQAELQLLESLDDLRLEPIQLSQVQVDVLTVQLPQGSDHLAELLLVQILLFEDALQFDRFLDALPSLATELPDVSLRETTTSSVGMVAVPTEASLILPVRVSLTALLTRIRLILLTLTLLTLLALVLSAPLTEPT